MKRSLIREYVFMFLYQLEIHHENIEKQKKLFLDEFSIPEEQLDFFDERVNGVYQNKAELDSKLEPFLIRWKIERLPRIDITILRLALFEMLELNDIPNNVAISEAVRLAKKYSGEESKSYINAILGNIDRGLSKGEE